MKEKETQRTESLDATLKDVDTVVEDLKAANVRREAESRILVDQINGLKEQVPKALEGWKASGDAKLAELSQEVQSLRKLLENRVGRSGGNLTLTSKGPTSFVSGNANEQSIDTPSSSTAATQNTTKPNSETVSTASAPAPGIMVPKHENSSSSSPGIVGRSDRKATIPAWQRAATEKNDAAESGKTEAGA